MAEIIIKAFDFTGPGYLGYDVPDGECADWNALVAQAAGSGYFDGDPMVNIASYESGETCDIIRTGLLFDTTQIPEGAVISDGRAWLYGMTYSSGNGSLVLPADVQVRVCSLLPGSGNYLVAENYARIRAGALAGVMEFAQEDGLWDWWKTCNLASLITRVADFAVGVNLLIDAPNPPEGCPPVPYDSESVTAHFWKRPDVVGYEPKLIVTYELPVAPAAGRLALLGAGR